ncbi:LuxR C-terminal-related transcriptional regulator [Sedimentimonas flavescens]|uniref:LuxR C-terminal-related transcriptional regulator n=1 Tax=Sedimentimonas flavescens TaxID=2851012 RepID=A0ABT3A032_9RHOB|nr:LuxR C-terminal-related transcriptional regulator [Sedimentimonas flavescens]MCV2879359.1 LuxR C-terminal-related transcriptional regulator [Sedimentimonas flavescens]
MENKVLTLDDGRIQAVAALLESLGSDRFPTAFRQLVRSICSFDSLIATRYPANQPPVSLFHDLDDVQAAITVQFYATGPYLLDPLYLACKGGSAPGAYRLLDLAPEAFYRSQYYRAFYRSIRIGDEVGLLIREGGSDWIIVSLARGVRQTRFTEQELMQLRQIFPILSAAVLRHWGGKPETAPAGLLEDRLESFGADILSPREAEIVRLILQGHSTPSAAAYLGISEGTVKVHRHHAYAKLGIASQAELFSLATRHFVG